MDSIEFLDDDADPPGDDDPCGQDRPPPSRATRIVLAVLAAAALVAIVVTLAVRSGGDDGSPEAAVTPVLPDFRSLPVASSDPYAAVNGAEARIEVPRGVTRAVRMLYPSAVARVGILETKGTSEVLRRHFVMRADRRRLVIDIASEDGNGDHYQVSTGPTGSVTRFETDAQAHHVIIQITDPASRKPARKDLLRLAHDPGLLAFV